jgi:hypothetical protein
MIRGFLLDGAVFVGFCAESLSLFVARLTIGGHAEAVGYSADASYASHLDSEGDDMMAAAAHRKAAGHADQLAKVALFPGTWIGVAEGHRASARRLEQLAQLRRGGP